METLMQNISVVIDYRELFFRGMFNTILLTTLGVSIGLVLGLFLGIGKLSHNKIFNIPASIYVTIFRGTPLYIQILIIHLVVIPAFCELVGFSIPGALVSGIVALSLNSGAYIAEIFRGGIQSLDKGQTEAARSLGMTNYQTMRYIIIPQAFKRMLPPLGNEFIALLKDSSLLAVIAVNELSYASTMAYKATFVRGGPLFTVAILYLILTLILTKFVKYLERRFNTE
ncbi:MAG: amino acid ABC transporter permease [Vulcanibacillus sp.]